MVSEKTLASGFVQQLSLSVPAAAEDLGPLVEGGGGGGEHDEVFLLQTQSAVQILHIPDVGLKLLALERICQEMVKGEPWSFSFQTCEERRVPGWSRCRQLPSCLAILSLMVPSVRPV